jgi:hypothetical protein
MRERFANKKPKKSGKNCEKKGVLLGVEVSYGDPKDDVFVRIPRI